MSKDLDKVLNNLQAQLDQEAEAKRKAEEKRRIAYAERVKKNEMEKRFPHAIEENQIEEVKNLLQQNVEREQTYSLHFFSFPSTEMAEIIIDDMRQVLADDKYCKDIKFSIRETILDHPEDARKWDKFAKDHDISYDLEGGTCDKKVFDTLVEQGFDVGCFDFERVAESYYEAKNGYAETRLDGPFEDRGKRFWINQNPEKAKKIKQDLIDVLSCGYPIDLSEKRSKSYLFMKELLKERELQKQGVDKSFIYRDPFEQFYDVKTGECYLSVSSLLLIVSKLDDARGGFAKGVITKRGFTGVTTSPEARYYKNGADVTQKRKALKKIAESRIAKEEKLSAKQGKPVILKKASKLEKALIAKKLKDKQK